jgi:hypothetical protein
MTSKCISGLLAILLYSFAYGQNIDISGEWRFKADREAKGISEKWFTQTLDDRILLPGSMPERLKGDIPALDTKWTGSIYDSSFFFYPRLEKYRQPGNVKFSFFLTPDRHYIGVAWYQKDIEIPASWKGRRITLYLERAHIETRLWVDGREKGMQNSLSVPHVYDLSGIAPGRHTLSIAVDNRIKDIDVGIDSHSISDQTQGNWNGITGKMELRVQDEVYFDDIQIYPDIAKKSATVKITVKGLKKGTRKGNIHLSAKSFNSGENHQVPAITVPFSMKNGESSLEAVLPFGNDMLTWDEFSPALYMLDAKLESGSFKDEKQVQFGMREFKINGTYFYVNGHKTVLRGTVESCLFPATGYPPADVDAWKKVFSVCKAYGLNHVRFHSYCPPEEAFMAADLAGMYLQPEGPSWPNHSTTLGDGRPTDKYIMDETMAISRDYGNYASFCMLALGNEPNGRNWAQWAGDFVDFWKARDVRRVYTGGSGWGRQPRNQFHVMQSARGLNWGNMPESYSIYAAIANTKEPFVSHETGQWCVFPNFDEIRKYTGVNKAKNFELFREDLADHDMGGLGHDFLMASGKLQALCYKHEIEKTLRTPGYAGFQLLCLNDYSGQGSALVGVTDVFWDEKSYITAAEFRKFCNSTVLLAKMHKFVFKNSETMSAEIETSHFGREPIKDAEVSWIIRDIYGEVAAEGNFKAAEIPVGNANPIGKVEFPLGNIGKASKYNLEVSIEGTEYSNDWNFWVYPELPAKPDAGGVYVTETFDSRALDVLNRGGNVLLLADGKISYGKSIVQRFTPIFWNTSWFKMRPPHTTGILVNAYHPMFKGFPTDYHSDIQWWELLNGAQVMLLSDFPLGFQPIIQPIDTWFLNRKIGMLFEARVGEGKLIMSSADLRNDLDKRIVARQLLQSVLDYMNSDYFRPQYGVDAAKVQELFTKEDPPLNTFTTQSPFDLIPRY